MVTERCRFCSGVDDVTKLVDPCDCYKKYDSLLCHPLCLEQHIAKRKQHESDHISDEADRCPECGKKFRVKLHWRWTKQRIFSSTSMTLYFNVAALSFSAFAFFYATYTMFSTGDLSPQHAHGENVGKEKALVISMVVIILIMSIVVLRKVYQRWERHQMDAEFIDIV
ncbi:hypothetical protein BSKO_08974 [Bryopsis sp. KO-2023]|nr:hypothetical protein BSKO_08974 [Bryopsis sp. KO-2023]